VSSKRAASKPILGIFPLLEKQWLNPFYYRLRLSAREIAEQCHPGQFVNVRLAGRSEPLLPRPLSIFRRSREEGWIELLVKSVGRGTRLFAQAHPGELFGVLGPLGRGFRLDGVTRAVLVGGGIGIVPLVFLAGELRERRIPFHFFQGFRGREEICCTEEIRALGGEWVLTTDDGSAGYAGTVTDLLEPVLKKQSELQTARWFVCGPDAMMRRIARLCRTYRLSAQFSVETRMACGFGACMGCAVPAADGKNYHLACQDGPVFDWGEIRFED